jgi:hypothetical protein
MELDLFFTGVLKVSHLCYMKGFYELLSWVSKKALVGRRCLTINTKAKRVVIVSSIITRIFLTLCIVGQSHFNLFNKDTRDLFILCIMLVCQLYRVLLLLLFNLFCCCLTSLFFFVHLLFDFCSFAYFA